MPLTEKDKKKLFDNEARIKELDQEREKLYQENKKIRYARLDELMGKYYKSQETDGLVELICPEYHCSSSYGNKNIREFHGVVFRSCLTSPYRDDTYFDFDELGKVEIIINPSHEDFYEEFFKEFEEITKEEFYGIVRQEYNKFANRVLENGEEDDNTTVEDTRKED